jgi:hypothetical protein
MPFTCSDENKIYLASGSTALARALRMVRADGGVFAFTNIRRNAALPAFTVRGITVPSQTYLTAGSLTTTDIVESGDVEKVNNLEATLIMGSWLPEADIRNGLFENAPFSLLYYCWRDLRPVMLRMRGFVGAPRIAGDVVTFKLRSLAQALQGEFLPVTSPLSRGNWEHIAGIIKPGGDHFFDPATDNTIDGRAATLTTTVTAADGTEPRRRFTATDTIGYPDQRFNNGRAEFTTGGNANFRAHILEWDRVTGLVTIDRPAPVAFTAGDGVKLRVHAPLQFADWLAYFGTGMYFPGEPEITTTEKAAEVNTEDDE